MSWLEDLQKAVVINSYTHNKAGVDAVGTLFRTWLEAIGYRTDVHERETVGNHLHFRTTRQAGKSILLLGHLDTVFPPDKFNHWSEDEGWVYGPGVCDMKGGNIVALEALRNIYDRFGAVTNVDMLLVSDEETGSDDSKSLTAKLAPMYDYCFVFEAAGADMEIVTGRKGIGTFEITIEGKASHAGTSYAKGIDANLEAARKLEKLVALTNLNAGSTVNVGKIEGGIGANTVSPHAKLLLELRYADHLEKERLMDALGTIVATTYVPGTKATLSGSIQRDVMEPDARQAELIGRLEAISGYSLPTENRGGVSDANIAASAGTVTLDGFGPYGDGDHTVHERAGKQSFIERIDTMTKILAFHQEKGDLIHE